MHHLAQHIASLNSFQSLRKLFKKIRQKIVQKIKLNYQQNKNKFKNMNGTADLKKQSKLILKQASSN